MCRFFSEWGSLFPSAVFWRHQALPFVLSDRGWAPNRPGAGLALQLLTEGGWRGTVSLCPAALKGPWVSEDFCRGFRWDRRHRAWHWGERQVKVAGKAP